MARSRLAVLATGLTLFIIFIYLLLPASPPNSPTTTPPTSAAAAAPVAIHASPSLLAGTAIMPHLGNETLKAELGRASWKLLHTTLARFPKSPTADEREALSSYLHLFARLYPCGECAAHFRLLLQEFPPQTSSRENAAQWGCHVHNRVNERLGKELFDCTKVSEEYKCGCAEADEEKEKEGVKEDGKVEGKGKGKGKGEGEEAEIKDPLERNVAMSKKHGARVEIQRDG
ncbi:ERV/ALR sulfhydryl oxidase domain-containing protein [Geopyxis carbonaria]|nr:ERV/ALR sulfhydryl oxidase domain-containing protein [Geopyxis carbonaria]